MMASSEIPAALQRVSAPCTAGRAPAPPRSHPAGAMRCAWTRAGPHPACAHGELQALGWVHRRAWDCMLHACKQIGAHVKGTCRSSLCLLKFLAAWACRCLPSGHATAPELHPVRPRTSASTAGRPKRSLGHAPGKARCANPAHTVAPDEACGGPGRALPTAGAGAPWPHRLRLWMWWMWWLSKRGLRRPGPAPCRRRRWCTTAASRAPARACRSRRAARTPSSAGPGSAGAA